MIRHTRQGDSHTALLHPATELVLVICALVVVFGVPSPLIPVGIIAASAIAAAGSRRVRLRRWVMSVATLTLPMLAVVLVVQGMFYPGEHTRVLWQFGPAKSTIEGLAVAAQLWLRVAATVAVSALFAIGSDAARVFDALMLLRVPANIAQACAAAISLTAAFGAEAREALAARAARGWNVSRLLVRARLLPGMITSLFAHSLLQLNQRRETLAQRGFEASTRPSALLDHPNGRWQRTVRIAAPAATVLIVAASLLGTLALPSAADIIGVLHA